MGRNVSLDVLKLLLAVMVIAGHTAFLADINELWNYLTRHGLFRIIVPSFLIINGFFFYHFVQNQQVKVWFQRLFILYGFWMLFYAYFWFRHRRQVDSVWQDAFNLFNTVFFGYFQLWYIPCIIGAGLLILRWQHFSTARLMTITVVLFAIGLVIQYLGNYHVFFGTVWDDALNNIYSYRNFVIFGFPFFCMGYLMNKTQLLKRIPFSVVVVGMLVSFGLMMAEAYMNYLNVPESEDFDFLLFGFFSCPFIVMFFMSIRINGNSKLIAQYASGLYFVHVAFFVLLSWHAHLNHISLFAVTLGLSLVATTVLILVNKKVKYIL